MERLLFTVEEYTSTVEYRIDEAGPHIVVIVYQPIFRGPGDHIGERGPVKSRNTKTISFADLRKAAERNRHPEYAEIDENNWKAVVSGNPKEGKKRRERG